MLSRLRSLGIPTVPSKYRRTLSMVSVFVTVKNVLLLKRGDYLQLAPRAFAGHRLRAALEPVGLEIVVVGAGGVAGLAGGQLPARAVGGGAVGSATMRQLGAQTAL